LRGDLWVRVAHGDRRPFRVSALGGVTQDVGTAFGVSLCDDQATVGVTEGVVGVQAADSGPVTLHASQWLRYGPGGSVMRLGNSPAADIAPWRSGELLLQKASVRDAIHTIGWYRSGPVLPVGDSAVDRRISAGPAGSMSIDWAASSCCVRLHKNSRGSVGRRAPTIVKPYGYTANAAHSYWSA
jgi:transmembrane sensor